MSHLATAISYASLAFAAGLVALGNSWALPSSLKDAPRYARPARGLGELRPELPMRKPEGSRLVAPDEDAAALDGERPAMGRARRVLLLKCASYYVIAASTFAKTDAALAQDYSRLGRAALEEIESHRPPTPGSVDEESVFMTVYQQYAESSESGRDLYDRYEQTCSAAVRPLLRAQQED